MGGFPFRIEVRCTDPTAEIRGEPPVALKAKDLHAAVQVYDPNLVISEIQGPLTIGEPGKPPAYVANWKLGQSSVRGTPEAPERVSFVFEMPTVERIADGGNANVFSAERSEVHGRIAAGSVVRSSGDRHRAAAAGRVGAGSSSAWPGRRRTPTSSRCCAD